MKREFLKGLGLEDETISKILNEAGNEIENEKKKVQDLQLKLDTVSKEKSGIETEIGTLKNQGENAEKLQKQISDLNKQIEDRKAADEKAELENSLLNRFDSISKDKQFINELTKTGVYQEFKEAVLKDDNKGKGDKDIYEELVKDRENIFESANKLSDVPPVGNIEKGTIDDAQIRAVMGLPL